MKEISDFEIEIPSKTFVVGEYLALEGGPSLMLATQPHFKFTTQKSDESIEYTEGFHPASRAAQFVKKTGKKFPILFCDDPHDGAGGFGRSSAEFLAVYIFDWISQKKKISEIVIKDLVTCFQSCGEGIVAPSGADLICQLKGGVCFYDGINFETQSYHWPWPNKSFLIFRTGQKIATHDHLDKLNKMTYPWLKRVSEKTIESFVSRDYFGFIQCLTAFSDQLNIQGLFQKEIFEKVQRLRGVPGVDAVKGCGAMGVDTVLLTCDKLEEQNIVDQVLELKWEFIANSSEVAQGVLVGGGSRNEEGGHQTLSL